VVRPKLIEAFNESRVRASIDKLIDIHEQVLPLIDQISSILVQAGAEHVQDRIKPGVSLPDDTEVAELITMLVRFRTQAVASVTATLARRSRPRSRSCQPHPRRLRREGTRRRGMTTPIRWCGGLLVTSSTTRLTSGTSLVMRVEMRSRTS